ncbi:hypothetical protein [Nocardioides sp. Soil796]|uniref:hypothetical protein n=1 Tax=Nocardioides sp. Soil796 TaxID=1736412 RepID=UPI00070BADCB|nr:hypothetical protein [Nocardioides sp. Soil796]KRF16132.1 hypothetical protein ASH02_05920 [Nocardioides sp. Soil796]
MTEELKTMMTRQADELEPFSPDIDAITGAGRRRLRSRRFGAAGAGVAVVLAVGLGVPQLVGGGSPDDSRDTNVAVTESAPSTWAQGSVIHVGDATVDVGHPVHSFVVTTAGFVSTDPDGKVWSTRDGRTEQVGEGTPEYGRQLVADGSWAGWIESQPGQPARFSFMDQAGDEKVEYSDGVTPDSAGEDSGSQAELFALDGDGAYLRDSNGLVRLDLGTRTPETLLADPGIRDRIDDVEQGLVLHTFDAEAERGPTVASEEVTEREPALAVDGGDLSPDKRFVMSENSADSSDDFTLIEVGTGADLTPPAKGDYAFFTGYAWIDDSSYMAFGIKELPQGDGTGKAAPPMPTDLLRCDAAARTCDVVQPGLDFSKVELPVGENIGD